MLGCHRHCHLQHNIYLLDVSNDAKKTNWSTTKFEFGIGEECNRLTKQSHRSKLQVFRSPSQYSVDYEITHAIEIKPHSVRNTCIHAG